MHRSAIVLCLVVTAISGVARGAAPEPGTSPVPEGSIGGGVAKLDRDGIFTAGVIIDAITGGVAALELATGWSSGAASGLTVCAAGAATFLGVDVIRQGDGDAGIWTVTLASGAILVYAGVDVLRRHLAPDRPSEQRARLLFVPTVEKAGDDGHSTRVGLAVAGTW